MTAVAYAMSKVEQTQFLIARLAGGAAPFSGSGKDFQDNLAINETNLLLKNFFLRDIVNIIQCKYGGIHDFSALTPQQKVLLWNIF